LRTSAPNYIAIIDAMFPMRNVGVVPFGFTPASADRIALRLTEAKEAVDYATWYWWPEPIEHDDRPASKGPAPSGIVLWTSRGVLVVALRFTWGMYWIAEAHVVRRYAAGEPLPVLVTSGPSYDSATIHGEPFWFAHDTVPPGFT
jgi:hypothetical protein